MRRFLALCAFGVGVLSASTAWAQQADLTLFLGRAFPIYDERLTLHPSVPSLPGATVTVVGNPEIRTDGGLVFGAALGVEFGVFGIEGRLDATDVGFDVVGARYNVRATNPPFQGLTGSVTVGDGDLDADRLYLLSINARIRTPGSVSFVASGGLSYLPDLTFTGSVPISAELAGFPVPPGLTPRLRLHAAPGESDHRFGVNGGAGLRVGGSRVAVMAEVRVFYFQEFELRFAVEDAPGPATSLLENIDPIRFDPIIVNAQAGLVIRF